MEDGTKTQYEVSLGKTLLGNWVEEVATNTFSCAAVIKVVTHHPPSHLKFLQVLNIPGNSFSLMEKHPEKFKNCIFKLFSTTLGMAQTIS